LIINQISFFDGLKGFIVCDGDYELFKQINYSNRRQYATYKSTCKKYLYEKNKINFITGIWISTKNINGDVINKINFEVVSLCGGEVKK